MALAVQSALGRMPIPEAPPREPRLVQEYLGEPSDAEKRIYREAMQAFEKQRASFETKQAVATFVEHEIRNPDPQVFKYVTRTNRDLSELVASMGNIDAVLAGKAQGQQGHLSRIGMEELRGVLTQLNGYHQAALQDKSPEGRQLADFLQKAMANAVGAMTRTWDDSPTPLDREALTVLLDETVESRKVFSACVSKIADQQ